eukprot:TRINITY_DN21822_c0_g2_i2.p1 TRINITY_DN21822_c0_g2~~TRINITY_DN21822_c0_g2_i2.p1  ORF type:complete len:627 (-),score=121.35 TRINITY_DN21822_c0_g2_i2:59-1939(-)
MLRSLVGSEMCIRDRPKVSLSGRSRNRNEANDTKEGFLQRTKRERAERELERLRQDSATRIQSLSRGAKHRRELNAALRASWFPQQSVRSTWQLLRFYNRSQDAELLAAQLQQLTPFSEFFLGTQGSGALGVVVAAELVQIALSYLEHDVRRISTAGLNVLVPWLSPVYAQRSLLAEFLRFATDSSVAWPGKSDGSTVVHPTAIFKLFTISRICVQASLAEENSNKLLQGALDLMTGPLVGCQRLTQTLASFVSEFLSAPNVMRQIAATAPLAATGLLQVINMMGLLESCSLINHRTLTHNAPLVILENLAYLTQLHPDNLPLVFPYCAAFYNLVKHTGASVLQNPDPVAAQAIKTLTDESHVRFVLVEAATLLNSQATQACDSIQTHPFYPAVAAHAELSRKSSKEVAARLLHLIASPTLGILSVLWKWMSSTPDFAQLLGAAESVSVSEEFVTVFALFCNSFDSRLRLLDDDEFYTKQSLMPLAQVESLVQATTALLAEVYWVQPATQTQRDAVLPLTKLIKNLHQKNSRKPFVPAQAFEPAVIPSSYFDVEAPLSSDPKLVNILNDVPHFAPFAFRARLFQKQLEEDYQNQSRDAVSYTHLRAHETPEHLVCRLLLEKKKKKT